MDGFLQKKCMIDWFRRLAFYHPKYISLRKVESGENVNISQLSPPHSRLVRGKQNFLIFNNPIIEVL